jgi:periplasmic protein TonB
MPLRCLLFTTDEAMVAPIWQVLARLGVEGEHCKNPVDAVERVTTQLFQIVITDWQDQPEAAFLLKTARDLKASARPLTLAIVGEESRSFALQAGANSVLLKPLRPEQVGDTLSTACQLLMSKIQSAMPKESQSAAQSAISGPARAAAAAAPAPAPISATYGPEKLRAGEFLQSSVSVPGAQFDTESDGRESLEVSTGPVDPLSELEPMASAVQEVSDVKVEPKDTQKDALTGWAALQARLTKTRPEPAPETSPKNELLGFEQQAQPLAPPETEEVKPQAWSEPPKTEPKEPSFVEQTDESEEISGAVATRGTVGRKLGKFLVGALALAAFAMVATPRSRQVLQMLYHHGLRETVRWLNPPPTQMPQTVATHDSFGQMGDEYKLPAVGSIPDATTDPSKIEVVPVVDPTAKVKPTDANGAQVQTTAGQMPISGDQTGANPENAATDQTAAAVQSSQAQSPAQPTIEVKEQTPAGNIPAAAPAQSPAAAMSQPTVPQTEATSAQPVAQQPVPVPSAASAPTPKPAPAPRPASASQISGIPASLRTQVAANTTPDASGVKPADTAMSSIGPVTLAEAAVRELLTQPVEPEYPAAAKSSGLTGSVVLQVSITPDGSVEDAKFLQGSFVFARAAIDAVKRWHFKPYVMNGRAVPVQSMITLNFKPPAP